MHQPQVANDFLSVYITSLDCGITIAGACLYKLCSQKSSFVISYSLTEHYDTSQHLLSTF